MKKLSALAILVLALGVTACDPNRRDVPVADGPDGAALESTSVDENGLNPLQKANQEALIANAGDRVYFDYDSFALDSSDKDVLNKQAAWLKTNSQLSVTVEGHCDERGTREYNIALGEKRANSVKNYLVSQGVAANRVNVVSYGKEYPEVVGSSEDAWAKNRRGVTVVN